jgi:hypothetical protein
VAPSSEKQKNNEINQITNLLTEDSPVIPYINFELLGCVLDNVIDSSDSYSYTNKMVIKFFNLVHNAPKGICKQFYEELNQFPGTFGLFSTSFLTTDLVKFLISKALDDKNSDLQLLIKQFLLQYDIPPNQETNLKYWWNQKKKNFSLATYFLNILISTNKASERQKLNILEVYSSLYQYNDIEFIKTLKAQKNVLHDLIFDDSKSIEIRSAALELLLLTASDASKCDALSIPPIIMEIVQNKKMFKNEMLYEIILELEPFISNKKVYLFTRDILLNHKNSPLVLARASMLIASSSQQYVSKKIISQIILDNIDRLSNLRNKYSISIMFKALGLLYGKKYHTVIAWQKAIDAMPDDNAPLNTENNKQDKTPTDVSP